MPCPGSEKSGGAESGEIVKEGNQGCVIQVNKEFVDTNVMELPTGVSAAGVTQERTHGTITWTKQDAEVGRLQIDVCKGILPDWLVDCFHHIDKTGHIAGETGWLEKDSIEELLRQAVSMRKAMVTNSPELDLGWFSPAVRDVLKVWDTDESGTVCMPELVSAAKAQEKLKKANKFLRMAVIVLVFVMVILMAGQLVLGYVSAQMAEDSRPDDSGIARTVGSNQMMGMAGVTRAVQLPLIHNADKFSVQGLASIKSVSFKTVSGNHAYEVIGAYRGTKDNKYSTILLCATGHEIRVTPDSSKVFWPKKEMSKWEPLLDKKGGRRLQEDEPRRFEYIMNTHRTRGGRRLMSTETALATIERTVEEPFDIEYLAECAAERVCKDSDGNVFCKAADEPDCSVHCKDDEELCLEELDAACAYSMDDFDGDFSKGLDCKADYFCGKKGECPKGTGPIAITEEQNKARFLIQATFGVTRDTLSHALTKSNEDWIKEQVGMKPSSHRQFAREHSNPRMAFPMSIGLPWGPCEKESRWTRRAVLSHDEGETISYTNGALYVGKDFRTLVKKDSDVFSADWGTHYICKVNFDTNEVYITENDDCPGKGGLTFTVETLSITSEPLEGDWQWKQFREDDKTMVSYSDSTQCAIIEEGQTTFAKYDAKIWRLEKRLQLHENSLVNPYKKKAERICPTARRNFVNSKSCKVVEGCDAININDAGDVGFFTPDAIKAFQRVTGKRIYGVRLSGNDEACGTDGAGNFITSRWIKCGICKVAIDRKSKKCADCKETIDIKSVGDDKQIYKDLKAELDAIGKKPDFIFSIEAKINLGSCGKGHKVKVEYGGTKDYSMILEHVDMMSDQVHDLSDWWDPKDEPATDFENAVVKLESDDAVDFVELQVGTEEGDTVYLGDMGGTYDLKDEKFAEMVSDDLSNALGRYAHRAQAIPERTYLSDYTLSCGSPFEVAAIPSEGHEHYFPTYSRHLTLDNDEHYDQPMSHDASNSKVNVWMHLAVTAPDQLRQRMAWALAQHFIVGEGGFDPAARYSETLLIYYDIFVRHAFGNFGDVLKEVTYSAMMGDYLTFRQNAAYDRTGYFPDENYAREIMQLFTVGLKMLNEDGSEILVNGETVDTYGLDEVQTNAAIFTGFGEENYRANIELNGKGTANKLDPMVMRAWKKDIYPKVDVIKDGGYIGDKRRLCDNVKPHEFLKLGSVYEFVGTTSPDVEVLALESDSPLRLALCGGVKECRQIAQTRQLPVDLRWNCPDDYSDYPSECRGSTLGVQYVKIEVDGRFLYFEYVPPECVYHTFVHENEGAPSSAGRNHPLQCSPMKIPVAGVKCCTGQPGCNDECSGSGHEGCSDDYNWRVLCDGDPDKKNVCRKKHKCNKKKGSEKQKCDASNKVCKDFLKWCKGDAWNHQQCGRTCYTKTKESKWNICGSNAAVDVYPQCEGQPRKRLTYKQAQIACGDINGDLCGSGAAEEGNCGWKDKKYARIWEKMSAGSCVQKVYLDMDTLEIRLIETDRSHITPFRVRWISPPTPKQGEDCPVDCESATINDRWTTDATFCKCEVIAVRKAVFTDFDEITTAKINARLHFKADEVPLPSEFDVLHSGVDFQVWATSGTMDLNSVIELRGMYLLNQESIVTIGKATFRNPPRFMVQEIITRRAAENEVNALLEHLQHHPNTPPMFAKMLIQRFVSSSPSPTYIKDVAVAFKNGKYNGIGSGKHGSLEATIAAVLLHDEARKPVKPSDGKLREPIVKLVNLLRTYEYKQGNPAANAGNVMVFKDLDEMIGNAPYKFPDVFGFYTPDHAPPRLGNMDVVAPEFNVLTGPSMNGFINGAVSFFRYGLSECNGGFSKFKCTTSKKNKPGIFMYNNTVQTGHALVDELNLLLTGGSMTESTLNTVFEVYDQAVTAGDDGFLEVQKAMLLTPEFHTMGPQGSIGPRGYTPPPVVPNAKSYKAMIQIFFTGGLDSFNLLVPTGTCTQAADYKKLRDLNALPPVEQKILTKGLDQQDCKEFAVHSSLEEVFDEYGEGNVAFFPNVGALFKPVENTDYKKDKTKLCQGLFSHNDQKNSMHTAKCQIVGAKPKGWGGRLADELAKDYTTTLFSMAGNSVFTSANEKNTLNIHPKHGSVRLYEFDKQMKLINNITRPRFSNIYAEEYSKQLQEEVQTSEDLGKYLEAATLSSSAKFSGALGNQLAQVAKVIATRKERNAERDIFYLQIGGFDMHSEVLLRLKDKFDSINLGLKAFIEEMRAQTNEFDGKPMWEHVALEIGSDFGRTLTANSEKGGSDHAWAGNYFMASGALKGGKGGTVVTKYPESLSLDKANKYHIGRGRFIPKYPWESMSHPLARWMGLRKADVPGVFPNKKNFPSELILDQDELFGLNLEPNQ